MSAKTPDPILLGHSPDADDAFMFYAMAEHKVDLRGWNFQHILQDIQTLNERALRAELHVSAVSIHAYAHLTATYALMPCGASMGDGYGPILVTRDPASPDPSESPEVLREWLRSRRIATPGPMTTAFLAMQLFGNFTNYLHVPFDQVSATTTDGRADVALIIHEGQLTYADEGFRKVVDLGEWWKSTRGLPLPLGGNVIRKDIPPADRSEITRIVRDGVAFGLQQRGDALRHSLKYARALEHRTDLADRFIGMYVNDYTIDYGDTGRAAIRGLLDEGHAAGLLPSPGAVEFVEI